MEPQRESTICDWSPPPEIPIIESEVFEIPSRLPSIDDFIRKEEEKEKEAAAAVAAAAAEDEQIEEEQELEKEEDKMVEVGSVESVAVDYKEEEPVEIEEIEVDDDFELQEVEVKKKVIPKTKRATFDSFGIAIQSDFDNMKARAKKIAEEELRLHLIDSTDNFIDKLIGNVVETCEYVDPDDILRAKLDRQKVLEELDQKLFELDIEQQTRAFLNKRAAEFFLRKKAMRNLTDDIEDEVLTQVRKYQDTLLVVNQYTGLMEPTRTMIATKIDELQKELKTLKKQTEEKAVEFVADVKRVFGADNSEKMESMVDILTKKMRHMRKEISEVRFVLIQRQHTMAVLQERSRKLEDLGNGLFMADFEHLTTETQALGKKIEERNSELNRLHARCNADIHHLAHIQEKQQMARNLINCQQSALDELVEEKQGLREYLNRLKIERGAIRREFKKVSFANGLLDKPELLHDFDKTEDKVQVVSERVAAIKVEQSIVDDRINEMVKMLRA